MAQSDGNGDGPDLNELLQGAAHGYDMLKKVTGGRDPKTRVAAQHLDKVSIQDAISQMNNAVGGGASGGGEPAKPLIDAHETEDGIEVTVDLERTMIEADEIDVEMGDDTLSLRERATGWNAEVSNVSDKIDANEVDVGIIRNNRLVSVTLTPGESDDESEEGDGLSTGLGSDGESGFDIDEATPDDHVDTEGSVAVPEDQRERMAEESDDDSDGDVPTVGEFIEENPWVRDVMDEDMIDMATGFLADQPVDEVLGDQLDDLGE